MSLVTMREILPYAEEKKIAIPAFNIDTMEITQAILETVEEENCPAIIAVGQAAIKDGKLDGGEFAHVYFIDWDHVRARHRQLNVTVMGTTEDVGDRKWNDGKVINTLRKFTPEEKAYDPRFDLQQKR